MTATEATTTDSRVRAEPNPRWIRGLVDGRTVVDSRSSMFVWEVPYYPQWYFPTSDLQAELRATGSTEDHETLGTATVYDLVIPAGGGGAETVLAGAARRYERSAAAEIRDLVRLDWAAIEQWLEEEVEVFVHPRSPYTRVDVLPSTRHVTVAIDGTVVADSHRPSILYETGLPPRYYLPPEDVRQDLLSPTDSSTACPYKGVARYWSVTVDGDEHGRTEHPDIVWGYDDPLPESAAVKGLVCFYNEKVEITVDGEPLARPNTKFS